MSIGVCYFPEHWPEDRWETDVRAMADAGIEYVRMGEFSWGVIEPERDEFHLEWLDRAVDLVGEYGMKAVLCTPTAAPPRWLVEERPGIQQVDRDGTVRDVGSRRHYCFNSPAYREETERIVERMADRYEGDPTVVGWQTDNEYGCHGTVRCYCDDCTEAFREWLRDRYGDAETLNDAWGTTFWSQQYGGIDDVTVPRPTPGGDHPSLVFDLQRFHNDSVVEYNRLQTEVLRAADEEWFVTHNFMHDFEALEASRFEADLEFASWDSYPTGHVQTSGGDASRDELRAGDPDRLALNHDRYRGALDAPFWIMEQQPGDVNWPPESPQPAEGAMRLWAHHAVAHGADVVTYFRWRRCLEGQEQYHAGLRAADGSPDRGYHDAARAAEELPDVEPVDAPVAVLHDAESAWALGEQSHTPTFDYWGLVRAFHGAVRARGVQADVVPPRRDLDEYEAVIAPTLHLATPSLAAHLRSYVEDGGQLLVGPRSGYKDEHNTLRSAPQPGPLADIVGATVDQHETIPPSFQPRVRSVDGGDPLPVRTWAEWLDPDSANPLFAYDAEGVTDGRTAVVAHDVGDGRVEYCGTWPEADLADELVRSLLDRTDVGYAERLPDGVRVTRRDDRTWIFNFTGDEVTVDVDGDPEWTLGGFEIGPFDLAIAAGDVVPDCAVESGK